MGGILCGTVQHEYDLDYDPINDRYTRKRKTAEGNKEVSTQKLHLFMIKNLMI